MEKSNHHHISAKRKSSHVFSRMKNNKNNSVKKFLDKNILRKIFHPDYILFDWEFYSRELEFE